MDEITEVKSEEEPFLCKSESMNVASYTCISIGNAGSYLN